MGGPISHPPESPPAPAPSERRRSPRSRTRARQRQNPWLDRALLVGGLLCAGLVVLGVMGQQRQVARMTDEVAQLREQAAARAAAAPAGAAAAATAAPTSLAPQPTATLPPTALQTLRTTCADVAPALGQYQRQFLAPMHYWGLHALRDLPAARVTYLFAGPDSATAVSVFPRAEHLVLVANQTLEPAGAPAASASVQAAECQIWRFFARMGYFRTHDLDGRHAARPRVAAMLLQGLELADLQVAAVEYLALDSNGSITPTLLPDGQRPFGIRFHATRPDGRRVAVDYVTIDLSDAALQRNPAQSAALRSLLSATVLLKAASHLPQEPSFSQVARWTAELAPAVVQDETGLSVQSLRSAYALRYYGQFTQAHSLWRGKAATVALRQDVEASEVEPLLFTFGYEKPSGSLVIVARRPAGIAAPAQAAAPAAAGLAPRQ
jgi:hypothetical protein